MSHAEQLIYEALMRNPRLSKMQLMRELHLSSATISTAILNLIQQQKLNASYNTLVHKSRIIAIGGANVDRKFYMTKELLFGDSNPAHVTESVGGVARNIADNLGRLGHLAQLLTVMGKDYASAIIEQNCAHFIDFSLVEKKVECTTGSYTAILTQHGELIVALADMDIYDSLRPEMVEQRLVALLRADCIVIDLNCPKETIQYVQQLCGKYRIPLAVIPVSSPKMDRMPETLEHITYFICNRDEAQSYLQCELHTLAQCEQAVRQLQQLGAHYVLLTLGEEGVLAANETIVHYAARPIEQIVDVTGAGDAFVSGFLHGILTDESFADAIGFGMTNAAYTLQSATTVRSDLTREQLQKWRGLE